MPSSKSKKWLILCVSVGVVVGFTACLAVVSVLVLRQRRRHLNSKRNVVGNTLVPYGYNDLRQATKNSEKLGGGGFSSVFKGTLSDTTAIAVRKLEGLFKGEKQFRTELRTIGIIQQVHLVKLWWFCSEGTKRLPVYDYMPNGSLARQLFNESVVLDWKTRYQITLGTARGLAYFHENCRECIIHCDIKPENVLLEDNFSKKSADFSMAKIIGRDFGRALTTMRGTIDYLAPEWISGLPITVKADVYSHGMMLFEIVSGKGNTEKSEDGRCVYFPLWSASQIREDEVLCFLDHRLEGKANIEELRRAGRVACWCTQDGENHRPLMGQAVQRLQEVTEVGLPPIPRILQNIASSV